MVDMAVLGAQSTEVITMDKLIITVTCDSTMAYPSNPYNPTPGGIEAVSAEYVRAANAGAAICHLHGPYTIDEQIQADGTKLSDLDIPGGVEGKDSARVNVYVRENDALCLSYADRARLTSCAGTSHLH